MKMYCDNQVTLHILPIQHSMKLNTQIYNHFILEKLLSKEICTEFIGSNDQLVDLLTKLFRGP